MIRRLPLIPTILVVAAVAIMIALGFWQLSRLKEKQALLAHYAEAETLRAEVPFPQTERETETALYRRSRVECAKVVGLTGIAGHNAQGESGIAQVADCMLADGGKARVVLGWSRDVAPRAWPGGLAVGVVAPGPRLIADPPLMGLAASGRPDPADIPNNHLAYAGQWFLFAATALIIYAIALRRRGRK